MRMTRFAAIALTCVAACLVLAGTLSAQPPKRQKTAGDTNAAAPNAESDESAPDDAFDDAFDDFDGPSPFGPPGGFGPPDAAGGPGRNQPPGPPPSGFGGMPGDMASLESDNPELFKLMKKESELGRRVFSVAMKVRRATKDEREEIRENLKQLITEQFDIGQQRRELELKYRSDNKDKIIEKQIARLLSRQDGDRRGPRRPDNDPPPGGGQGSR